MGGGKTFSLLFYLLRFVDCPNFYGVVFRKTLKQIQRSIWREAKGLFMQFLVYPAGHPKSGKFIGKARIREIDYTIVFPSGAVIEFAYLASEKDAIENFQGAQLTAAIFDEFTHFDQQ